MPLRDTPGARHPVKCPPPLLLPLRDPLGGLPPRNALPVCQLPLLPLSASLSGSLQSRDTLSLTSPASQCPPRTLSEPLLPPLSRLCVRPLPRRLFPRLGSPLPVLPPPLQALLRPSSPGTQTRRKPRTARDASGSSRPPGPPQKLGEARRDYKGTAPHTEGRRKANCDRPCRNCDSLCRIASQRRSVGKSSVQGPSIASTASHRNVAV